MAFDDDRRPMMAGDRSGNGREPVRAAEAVVTICDKYAFPSGIACAVFGEGHS